jgi:hypothetical protein
MELKDLKSLDLNTLIGCKLTAQEAFVFLEDLQNTLANFPQPQDLSQVKHLPSFKQFTAFPAHSIKELRLLNFNKLLQRVNAGLACH